MGGSEGSESGGIGGEWGVGTIVWVRRRNGSWWPGRILGQEELSASHLMSPRSGTPVKLLGREDASVDWYNLEKSKRVKAFRCGEFDTCIERAEASQGVPIKKREKYARREDAILHALELEKKMLDNNPQKIGSSTIKYSGALKEEQNEGFSSGNHLKNGVSAEHGTDGAFVNKSQLIYRKVDHFSETGGKSTIFNIKGKGANLSSWDDDTWEEAPRMRELQDFGLQSAPSRRKIAASAANESTQRLFVAGAHSRALSGFSRSVEGANTVTTRKKCPPFKKQKIYGGFSEESSSKRQDRHRPLVQALRSSTKLSTEDHSVNLSNTVRSTYDTIPHNPNNSVDYTGYSSEQMQVSPVMLGYPGSLIEENSSSGLNEADESDTVEEVSSDDTEDDETLYRDHPQSLLHVSNNSGRYFEDDSLISFPDKDKYGNYDGHDGPLLPGYLYHQDPHQQKIGTSADLGVSKRDFKGKCNTHNLTKMPMEPMDDISERFSYNSLNGRTCKSRNLSLKSNRERITLEQFHVKYDNFYQDDFIERDLSPQSRRSRSRNHSSILKRASGYQEDGDINDSDEESLGMFLSISEDDEPPSKIPRGYWETEDYQFDQFYAYHLSGGLESMWVDVDLKVQATYQGERVPLVSLMSRLNGQAIIGHPLQIETLDDSFTNCLISNNSGEGPTSGEGNETPPVWRTGRRTAMQRVPHPRPLPVALEGTESEPRLYSDSDIKPPFEKPYVVNFDNQTRATKKSNSRRPVKSHKKASKKVSLSNQKIRRLSSFAIQHKHGRAKGKLSTKGRSILDGLMKPGVSPMVTCIPVKIVFSRILEAIGRSPSSTTTNRGVTVLYRSVLCRKRNHHDPKP